MPAPSDRWHPSRELISAVVVLAAVVLLHTLGREEEAPVPTPPPEPTVSAGALYFTEGGVEVEDLEVRVGRSLLRFSGKVGGTLRGSGTRMEASAGPAVWEWLASRLPFAEAGRTRIVCRVDTLGLGGGALPGPLLAEVRLSGDRLEGWSLEWELGGGQVRGEGTWGVDGPEGVFEVVSVDARAPLPFSGCADGALRVGDGGWFARLVLRNARPTTQALGASLARLSGVPAMRWLELEEVGCVARREGGLWRLADLRFRSPLLSGEGAGTVGERRGDGDDAGGAGARGAPGALSVGLDLELDARFRGSAASEVANEPGMGPILADGRGEVPTTLWLTGTWDSPSWRWDRSERARRAKEATTRERSREVQRQMEDAMGLPGGALDDPEAERMRAIGRGLREAMEDGGVPRTEERAPR